MNDANPQHTRVDTVVTGRPHYVPQTYLRAWTPSSGSDRQLAYRRRNSDTALLTSTRNVAVACGIYGTGELGQAREETFQRLETEWPDVRDDLIAQGDLQGDRRKLLSVFMAVQLTRTIKHTNTVMFMSDLAASTTEHPISGSAVREFLVALDGVDPDDAEVEAARQCMSGAPGGPPLTRDQALNISATIALDIAPRLEAKSWTVRRFRAPTLWTNDCPVHPWCRPDPAGRPGGIGVETADEVRFPLSPAALLVMTRPGTAASNASARQVNAEIAKQCQQFVAATQDAKAKLDSLAWSKPPPRLRFGTINGNLGEALHIYVG
jgi:hypothetical protein